MKNKVALQHHTIFIRMAMLIAVFGLSGLAPRSVNADPTAYTFEVIKDNPRFYWNFNELGNMDDAVDIIRRQANDNLVSNFGATRGASFSANLGNAATFDGGNDFFLASGIADYEMPSAWSIELWAKVDGSTAGFREDYLMNAGNLNGPNNNPALIYDFSQDAMGLFGGGGRTDNVAGAPIVSDNDWHHYVYTFYGNGTFGVADRVDIAVDGVVNTVSRGGFSSGFDFTNQLIVGAALTNSANAFQGQIDELAFYDFSGMTQAEIASKVQDIASHYALGSLDAATDKMFVDASQISYSYSGPPAVQYGNSVNRDDVAAGTPGSGKLIDGVIASTNTGTNLSDGSTVGFADPSGVNGDNGAPHPGITFDLGGMYQLDEILVDYIGANGLAGVEAPESLEVRFSTDGVNFDNLMTFSEFNDESHSTLGDGNFFLRRLVAETGGMLASHLQLDFYNDQEWTFLSEIQFIGREAVVPEPGAIAIWALLGCTTFALRRHWQARNV
jgi:hypothetical protein